MEISVRFACGSLAYVTVTEGDTVITTDVSNIYGQVDDDFIQSLRELADELEQFNEDNKS